MTRPGVFLMVVHNLEKKMKGNVQVRMLTLMVMLSMVLAHFSGQVDLLSPTWLWLGFMVSAMGFQASFTGVCPSNVMFKGQAGGCCSPKSHSTESACCSTEKSESQSGCCSTDKGEAKTGCCSDDKSAPVATAEAEAGCCGGCGGADKAVQASADKTHDGACCASADCASVIVLGSGCASCEATANLIEQTATELNVKICLAKVADEAKIVAYGVMSTPGVVINNVVVHSGGVPSKQQVTDWLTQV